MDTIMEKTVKNIYHLIPADGHKSFYGKAVIEYKKTIID